MAEDTHRINLADHGWAARWAAAPSREMLETEETVRQLRVKFGRDAEQIIMAARQFSRSSLLPFIQTAAIVAAEHENRRSPGLLFRLALIKGHGRGGRWNR